jgi:hypothetical protein
MNREQARHDTDIARKSFEVSFDLLGKLYREKAWAVLGYPSWDAYTATEFGELAQLARAQRVEVEKRLAEEQMPQRAIAAAVGTSQQQVQRDLANMRATQNVSTPDPQPAESGEIAAQAIGGSRSRVRQPTSEPPAGDTRWSRQIEKVSAGVPMNDLTTDEVKRLHGAAEFLLNYCIGTLKLRKEKT